ncbi:MAG: hypothetical protein U5J96_15180 [Ignavibacteriaceae bacterium]|nr:hypothetical protein [Ignavibacteriaceae bacterium]
MDDNCLVPLPINFNCWKHHAGFIKKQIESVRAIKELEELKVYLLKIGESQMDLYFGRLSPSDISEQILSALHRIKIFEYEQYKSWLSKDGKDFQLVELKDKSVWALRLNDDIRRYVHIHPGRYSPHTVRVKATTLKTAIFLLCIEQLGEINPFETETVNNIRKKYLNEPPLKSFSNASGLRRLIDLFHKRRGLKLQDRKRVCGFSRTYVKLILGWFGYKQFFFDCRFERFFWKRANC